MIATRMRKSKFTSRAAAARPRAVNWSQVADEFSGPDPFRREAQLELEAVYYPLGFPLELATNRAEINMAAGQLWSHFPPAFEKPPLRVRVAVEPGTGHPPAPI